jgi:hypothetical protein
VRVPVALIAAALLVACNDEGGFSGSCMLSFDPPTLDFGQVVIGQLAQMNVNLVSSGCGAAVLPDFTYDPASATSSFLVKNLQGTQLQATLPLVVQFGPAEAKDYSGTLSIAYGKKKASLSIQAAGVALTPACPAVAPPSITFPAVEIGRSVLAPFSVNNSCQMDTDLSSIVISDGAFSSTVAPAHLPGGGSITGDVHFSPTRAGAAHDDIQLVFAGGKMVQLQVSGTAVAAGQLSCDKTRLDFGQVQRGTTVGSQHVHCTVTGGQYTVLTLGPTPATSADFSVPNPPLGSTSSAVDFDVAFVAKGPAQMLSGTVAIVPAVGMPTDIALTAEVLPPSSSMTAITVTLTWNAPVDLDLHMTRNGAQPSFDSAGGDGNDCYWAKKEADWGVVGNPDDDPFLDKDNTNGTAPEQINLLHNVEKRFDVWVHYTGAVNVVPTTASIALTIMGGSVIMSSQMLTTCGSLWHVGTIDMNMNSFTPSGAVTMTMFCNH